MKLSVEVGLGPIHIVLDGDPAHPPQKGHSHSQFSAHVFCGKRLDGLRCHLVRRWTSAQATLLDGDTAPPKKGAQQAPIFGRFCCGQMAGWTQMPLGAEVGLSPGDIVLYGDAALPPKRGRAPPLFGPCLLWPNSWMNQDATWCTYRS